MVIFSGCSFFQEKEPDLVAGDVVQEGLINLTDVKSANYEMALDFMISGDKAALEPAGARGRTPGLLGDCLHHHPGGSGWTFRRLLPGRRGAPAFPVRSPADRRKRRQRPSHGATGP